MLSPGNVFLSYSWQDGTTNHQFNVDSTTGTDDYWVRVENLAGCFSSDTINVSIDTCVSINTNLNTQSETMIVYPNPAKSKLYIRNQTKQGDFVVSIFNSQGVLVKEQSVYFAEGEIISIDINNLAKGFYSLLIINNMITIHKKIIVL
jgi:hypothetical protein